MSARLLKPEEAANVAIALRGNGLVRGRAEYLNDGRVMVPVAIRPDVTPEELAAALKATQPELPYDTLSAIGSSPTRFEDGRVLLELRSNRERRR